MAINRNQLARLIAGKTGQKAVRASKRFPGRLYLDTPGGTKEVDVKNVREGVLLDTVEMLAAAVTSGAEYNFFRDITNKDKIDTNVTTSRRLATGEKMKVTSIGVYIPSFTGNSQAAILDQQRVYENGWLTLKINKQLIAEGPLVLFPSGYGLVGPGAVEGRLTAPASPQAYGSISNGMPATKMQYKLKIPQEIYSEHDIDAKIKFYARDWLNAAFTDMPTLTTPLTVKVILSGLIWGVN